MEIVSSLRSKSDYGTWIIHAARDNSDIPNTHTMGKDLQVSALEIAIGHAWYGDFSVDSKCVSYLCITNCLYSNCVFCHL